MKASPLLNAHIEGGSPEPHVDLGRRLVLLPQELAGPLGISPSKLAVRKSGLLASLHFLGETDLPLFLEGNFGGLLLGLGGLEDLAPDMPQRSVRALHMATLLALSESQHKGMISASKRPSATALRR